MHSNIAEIIREKERIEALFEHASVGILVANDLGIIELVNNCLVKQFSYSSKDELIGKSIEVLLPEKFRHGHIAKRSGFTSKPEHRAMGAGRDLFAMRKDGTEFPVEISLGHYQSEEGVFVIAFIVDITLRKAIELDVLNQKEALRKSYQKIEELNDSLEKKVETRTVELQDALNQLEASRDELSVALSKEKELGDLKSRFVSMASHEFITPLSTILSSVSLLAKYTESGEQEKRDKHIRRIKTSVNTLTGILNEFLSIGKIEDGKVVAMYRRFNIREFMETLSTEMQGNAKMEQRVIYQHSGDEWVELDDTLLRHIVFNLLSNAIKFTSENGVIEMFTLVNPEYYRLTVRDNGIGISKEDQKHLFERFFRASNATNIQGTGLGLHIVEKYAELMDGEISFTSELEKGTTISITFVNQQHIHEA